MAPPELAEHPNKSKIRLVLFLIDETPTRVIQYTHVCALQTSHESCVHAFLHTYKRKEPTSFLSNFAPDFPSYFRDSPNFPILQSAYYYLISRSSLPLNLPADINVEYVYASIIVDHYSRLLANRRKSENEDPETNKDSDTNEDSDTTEGSERAHDSENDASERVFTQQG